MTILTELRAALGRYQACNACRNSACIGCENDARIGEPMLYDLLTDDTIRALLDVAEAAWALADNIDTYCPCCDSHLEIVTVPLCDDAAKVYAALAPLVKEADCPTCHGHGGGGGFDRNGSHTEERYCEYPCPTCGKEATDEP